MIAQIEVPQSQAAVVETIEGERRKIREWAEVSVREIEAERDRQLAKLDQAAAAVAVAESATPPPAETPPAEEPDEPKPAASKPKRRRKPPKSTSPADAAKRREAVYKLLIERGEPLASGVIRRELDLSQFQVKTATKRLVEEGRARRHGEGSATTYEGVVKPGTAPPTPAPPDLKSGQPETNGHGTLQGRMLVLTEKAGSSGVTLSTFVEKLGASQDQVVKELGELVREGEVKLTRKAGQSVYIPAQ